MRCFIDARLYGIKPKQISDRVLTFVLNSTLSYLLIELYGRLNLGEGALDVKVYEYASMVIPNPKLISDGRSKLIRDFLSIKIESIFTELGASSPQEISLNRVKPERRELDKIVMGEILGLTDEEQLEVYRAVIDLVKSRIEKAKSVKSKKTKKGIDVGALKNEIVKLIDEG